MFIFVWTSHDSNLLNTAWNRWLSFLKTFFFMCIYQNGINVLRMFSWLKNKHNRTKYMSGKGEILRNINLLMMQPDVFDFDRSHYILFMWCSLMQWACMCDAVSLHTWWNEPPNLFSCYHHDHWWFGMILASRNSVKHGLWIPNLVVTCSFRLSALKILRSII